MAIKKEKFQKVFLLGNPDDASDAQMSELLMVSENWDYYFSSLIDDADDVEAEMMENVEFVEFGGKKECNEFMDSMDGKRLIDVSFQHKKPCLLMCA